jgi:spatacsin
MQVIAKSTSTNPLELWKSLPKDSLAPLACYVWNKDPTKFRPGSPETEALSGRLSAEYPFLAALVKGDIPHPLPPKTQPPESQWRSPIFTSKYDLELHDLIASHFDYDFTKVFTDYYKNQPGQPPFPHFDHPELITGTTEPPYLHYIRALLPVSGFQQAIEDGLTQAQLRKVCVRAMKLSLTHKNIRLSVLSFIELFDAQFGCDSAVDYKLVLAVFDHLEVLDSPIFIKELARVLRKRSPDDAKSLQKRLDPNDINTFLMTAFIGVRCGLPIDYAPIVMFARAARPAELLLYLDRAEEIGAHYATEQLISIVKSAMPKTPLKDHLLFHFTQKLPPDDAAPSPNDPPALVVYRAIRRTDVPPRIALLEESLNRKQQVYAMLATSVEGSNSFVCALVALLTLTHDIVFDPNAETSHSDLVKLFLGATRQLFEEDKIDDLVRTVGFFSKTSFVICLTEWYRSVEKFTFRQADLQLNKLRNFLDAKDADSLLGVYEVSDLLGIFFPLQNRLARHCATRSQVHLFRFLQSLVNYPSSPLLGPRVQLTKVLEGFEGFRRALVECNLLGDLDLLIHDFVMKHSVALGQAAATCLRLSAIAATQDWLKAQYSAAETPEMVLEVHSRNSKSIVDVDVDPPFFVTMFVGILPYSQPSLVVEILEFARKHLSNESLSKDIDALLLHVKVCRDIRIEVRQDPDKLPEIRETASVLFPSQDASIFPSSVPLSITSPVLFSIESIRSFIETSLSKAIDFLLDNRRIDDAKLLANWRSKDLTEIHLVESIERLLSNSLQSDDETLLQNYAPVDDVFGLLTAIGQRLGGRFERIAAYFEAASILKWATSDLFSWKSADFVRSELSMSMRHWPLVRRIVLSGELTSADIATSLVDSFTNYLIGKPMLLPEPLNTEDYDHDFGEFTKLSTSRLLMGEKLFAKARFIKLDQSVQVQANLLLHASLCLEEVDECAEMLDTLLDALSAECLTDLVLKVVSVFPRPVLLPRFFQHLIGEGRLDDLPHSKYDGSVGEVIMTCARYCHPFRPEAFFRMTLDYKLYRDHAELQMEFANHFLLGIPTRERLNDANHHFLLALAYFLHEHSYSLAMECLKKLSLISLQLEVPEPCVFHLESDRVVQFMCTKEFPFALIIAVAYDFDKEENWAQAIYCQSIQRNDEEFIRNYILFRPVTTCLCNAVMEFYKNSDILDGMRARMKKFLVTVPNLIDRYHIAKELQFNEVIETMKEVNPIVCEWCEKVLIKP